MSTQTMTRPAATQDTYSVLITVETATGTHKWRAIKKVTDRRITQIKTRVRRQTKPGDVFEILLINERTGTQTYA